ncbi:glycoside hydrolase family 65 protein [Sphingomonas asaccharolytica]|uniref:glycoside hydrolase family 65 protein n=1 Tax=Sphingomonas asaccharolytica TaxID=40681 RepID=UPI000A8C68C3|nr:glycosyl hydrolase family 65 protein [Sphingomonas asaccharolytica]
MGRSLPEASFADVRFARDAWRLAADGDSARSDHVPALFSIGNGFIGIRGPGEAAEAPKVYLNGVYERVPIAYHEAAHGYARESDLRLAVADATRPAILAGGEPIGAPASVELDLARCVRTERFPTGAAEVAIEQFVSMTDTALVLTRVSFADGADVTVSPMVIPPPGSGERAADTSNHDVYDPRVAPVMATSPWVDPQTRDETGTAMRSDRLRTSGFVVACGMREIERRTVGRRVQVDFASAYHAGTDGHGVDALTAILRAAAERGYDALLAEQVAWFADFWTASNVAMPGQPRAELAIRFALAELAMAVGRDGKTSIGAKGQTGEGYEGHVFWDADLYVMPVFAFTQPAIARAMLAWRISKLGAARDNARAMGHEHGALYPWRTIGGHECSSYFPAGSAQYHINADIAYALETYLAATGDRTLLDVGGAAMLVETARIWLAIGYHDAARGGAFVINRVTGPDEYSAIVNNNLYTNMMAARHLRFAAREGLAASLIDDAEAAQMVRAADAMLLAYDDERQVYAQDDAYFQLDPWPFETTRPAAYPLLLHVHPLAIYRRRVSKQADAVLALALMPDAFDPAMRRRMLDTYEATTVHDSTLSASAFATAAAHAGDGARAAHYWRVAALTDLNDLFGNTDHGLHMAALAGSWTTLAMGFAGMRVDGDTLCFDPVGVPGLSDYRFTVAFRGAQVDVAVSGRTASVSVRGDRAVAIRVAGQEVAA